MALSLLSREQSFHKATEQEWDVIIIGGGATGCGAALDAASRGLKTLLVEKADFASGTSGRSTKLIHGGLRYL
ncbi:MAG TPA: FAD-dependent oxidoreductase, partial [Cytophagaceae bacterium]|nr:FAD-dependent oxidoreductase [Cytophagaceae bacterium]